MSIARIISVTDVHYGDSGQDQVIIEFVDSKGEHGTIFAATDGAHANALIARAKREGIRVKRDTIGAVMGPRGAHVVRRKPVKTGAYCSKCSGPHRYKHGKA